MIQNDEKMKKDLIRKVLGTRLLPFIIRFNLEYTGVMDKLLTGDNAKIFYRAFTHRSYNHNKSYESLTILGNCFFNTMVANNIINTCPNIDTKKFNNILINNID